MRLFRAKHWRRWLSPANRCVVPFNSFCEYADTKPTKTPTWFVVSDDQPLPVNGADCYGDMPAIAVALYMLLMAAVIVGVDLSFFRNRLGKADCKYRLGLGLRSFLLDFLRLGG